jgi:signal transduction histidine kinase
VYRTERPVRTNYDEHPSSSIAAWARKLGQRAAVASPIVVEGHLWGSIAAATSQPGPMPAEAEARIAQFADLLGTAIANLQTRSDLAESRARIVAAADEERRSVVRDLHDGAQQRLVHTIVTLKLARRAMERHPQDAAGLVDDALEQAETANEELRELAHGILPSVLAEGGLASGIQALASRMPIPVDIEVSEHRVPAAVEATAYFVVAEALTNVAKHSHARGATVKARLDSRTLLIEVADDGVGGAQADGPGMLGLRDRLSALDGTLRVASPAGGGTVISASIPVPM